MVTTIFVVSGDESELMAIRNNLQKERECHLILAMRGSSVIRNLEMGAPDLLICSFPLEDLSPSFFCRQVRILSSCPMLAIYDKEDKLLGIELLNAGCDVCLPKPVDWDEFLSCVDVLLRSKAQRHAQFRFGDIVVDFRNGRVWRSDQLLDITWREFNVLRFLILHMNEVVSREQILREVWQKPSGGSTRTVDQYIMKLRKLIEPSPKHPRYIITIYGYGYKFVSGEGEYNIQD